ncbi:hypothetical protein OG897_03915 [Streptomyces sp. NBC_00237]|uniref:hypothetical protein n=1 Tax=Streptomyces sp. NBC_00237 TaxID=2975687 RepID=UPI00224F8802|nr:hypothetical protein [Streptomyces sp. NBC_00237]MCX5200612.1 hypothetical protein [Streptomyces sp. NBC_00237]
MPEAGSPFDFVVPEEMPGAPTDQEQLDPCAETVRQVVSTSRDHEVTDRAGARHVLRLSLTLAETSAVDSELRVVIEELDRTASARPTEGEPTDGVELKGFSPRQPHPDHTDALRAGFRDGLPPQGPVAGCPFGNLTAVLKKVEVVAGAPTTEMYREACRQAAQDVTAKASWKVTEAYFSCEVTVASERTPDVYKVLSSRQGTAVRADSSGSQDTLEFHLPVRQAFGLSSALRHATSGKASCTLAFSHWADAGEDTLKELKSSKPKG